MIAFHYLDQDANPTSKDKAEFVRVVTQDSLGNRVEEVQVYYEGLEEDVEQESE